MFKTAALLLLTTSSASARVRGDQRNSGPQGGRPATASGDIVLVTDGRDFDADGLVGSNGIESVLCLENVDNVCIAHCPSCRGSAAASSAAERGLGAERGVRSARQERRVEPRGVRAAAGRSLQTCDANLAAETEVFANNDDCSLDWGLKHILKVPMDASDMSSADPLWLQLGSLSQTPAAKPVKLGIVDSGVPIDHPDFQQVNVVQGDGRCRTNGRNGGPIPIDQCEVGRLTNDHGAHCAGTMAAARNGAGVAGVLPTTRCASDGTSYEPIPGVELYDCISDYGDSSVLMCLDWLVSNGVHVSSHSYGFYTSDNPEDLTNEAYYLAFTAATAAGQVMVAASGNNGYELGLTSGFGYTMDMPTGLPGVIGVAALEADIASGGASYGVNLVSYSNYGTHCLDRDIDVTATGTYTMADSAVEVSAPGDDILSTLNSGYDCYGGTSMASPHVAGAIATLMAMGACPTATVSGTAQATIAFKNLICKTSNKDEDGGSTECGGIDLDAAIKLVAAAGQNVTALDAMCDAPDGYVCPTYNTGGGSCQAISSNCNVPCDGSCCACSTFVGCQGGPRSLCTGKLQ